MLCMHAAACMAPAQTVRALSYLRQETGRDEHASRQVDPYSAGCERLARGDVKGAIGLLSLAVRQSPERADCRIRLAEAYIADQRPEAATPLLERVLAEHAERLDARIALAQCVAADEPARVIELLRDFEKQLEPAAILLLAEARRASKGSGAGSASAAAPRSRLQADATADSEYAATIRRGLKRFAADVSLHAAHIDASLAAGRYAAAARDAHDALRLCGPRPALHWRAALAHFIVGEYFGDVTVETVADGREGQFVRDRLLIEQRDGADRFLCCGERSALYQLRRALDGGLDTPAAHLMHAEIWQRMGKPKVGLGIVKRHEAAITAQADARTLETIARIAFEADELGDFARYARLQARLSPDHSRKVLVESYLQLAARYNQRGDARMYVTCLERAARLAPADAELAYRLGEARWDAGRREGAIECFHRVLELEPEHPQRGRIIERMGQWQEHSRDPGL